MIQNARYGDDNADDGFSEDDMMGWKKVVRCSQAISCSRSDEQP